MPPFKCKSVSAESLVTNVGEKLLGLVFVVDHQPAVRKQSELIVNAAPLLVVVSP